jgi:hypothetical protein
MLEAECVRRIGYYYSVYFCLRLRWRAWFALFRLRRKATLIRRSLHIDPPKKNKWNWRRFMPHHTKFYDVSLHGGGGTGLPADREIRFPAPLFTGERS